MQRRDKTAKLTGWVAVNNDAKLKIIVLPPSFSSAMDRLGKRYRYERAFSAAVVWLKISFANEAELPILMRSDKELSNVFFAGTRGMRDAPFAKETATQCD